MPAAKPLALVRIGPPSKTVEGEQACLLMERGWISKDACKKVGLPRSTLWHWINTDEHFRERYERARIGQAHAMAEDAIEIADTETYDMAVVQRNRLRVDTRKWFVSKIAPRIYGDKIEHTHAHTVGVVMLPPLSDGSPTAYVGAPEARALTAPTAYSTPAKRPYSNNVNPNLVLASASQGADSPECGSGGGSGGGSASSDLSSDSLRARSMELSLEIVEGTETVPSALPDDDGDVS